MSAFLRLPFVYRRAAIKDAIGKARSYLSNRAHWQASGKRKGEPGLPGASNHPTLYQGTILLEEGEGEPVLALSPAQSLYRASSGAGSIIRSMNSRYFQQRRNDPGWEKQSPKLVLRKASAELHFPQTKEISAKKIKESKLDPDLVTVAVDLNVKNLAVITVRQQGAIIETVFLTDHGLDQQRYQHLKRIAKKQWQSGKPVKGEHSNQQLWRHVSG